MAAKIADWLSFKEEEICCLSNEIGSLLEQGLGCTINSNPSPALEQIRTKKLKYWLAHLQRSLKGGGAGVKSLRCLVDFTDPEKGELLQAQNKVSDSLSIWNTLFAAAAPPSSPTNS